MNEKNERKKIAFYIGSLRKGGAERVFVNLADYFQTEGYRVVMVTQYQREDEYDLPDGIERILSDIGEEKVSASRVVNFFRRLNKLHVIWKEQEADLVLSCIGKNNFMTVVTTMGTKTKAVVSVVGEAKEEYPSRGMRMLADFLFSRAAGVILQTERSRSFFCRKVGEKAVILPNSLNPAFIRPRYEGARDKRIVSVGRMDANKNHEMQLRAFAALKDKYPEYSLEIYGDGELRSHIEETAAGLGVPLEAYDFTLPQNREDELAFAEGDFVVFGTPVIAGRVPNVLLPYLKEKVKGGGALAAPIIPKPPASDTAAAK